MVKDESKKNREPRDSGDCRSGLGREFFPRGAAIWIPVTLFVLLVLFQMVPLPAGVLKVVSPATYELYEEILPEVGERQRSEVRSQKSEGQEQETEVGGQRSEVGSHPSEMRSAVVNEFHRAGKSEVGREWRCISINRHGTLRMLLKFLSYIHDFRPFEN